MRASLLLVPLLMVISLLGVACGSGDGGGKGSNMQWSEPPEMTIDVNKTYRFTMETSMGTLSGVLSPKDAPVTVNNFVFLAKQGYFDGVIVHRVLKGFVIQTGDPTGTGSGGPGYRFQDEPVKGEYLKGTLAMANAGPNTNGSQFFVVLGDLRNRLPKDYTIFGQVEEGLDALDRIGEVEVKVAEGGSEKSRPVATITVTKVTIEER